MRMDPISSEQIFAVPYSRIDAAVLAITPTSLPLPKQNSVFIAHENRIPGHWQLEALYVHKSFPTIPF